MSTKDLFTQMKNDVYYDDDNDAYDDNDDSTGAATKRIVSS